MEKTAHFTKDNLKRKEVIKNTIGIGTPVARFYWDKGHPNGAEYHTVTSTGIVIISNVRTHKLITMLIARPQQIIRYYKKENRVPPQSILMQASQHQKMGYNLL